jgi:hypothetical protein
LCCSLRWDSSTGSGCLLPVRYRCDMLYCVLCYAVQSMYYCVPLAPPPCLTTHPRAETRPHPATPAPTPSSTSTHSTSYPCFHSHSNPHTHSQVSRPHITSLLHSLQLPTGAFRSCAASGEHDMRFVYCAVAVAVFTGYVILDTHGLHFAAHSRAALYRAVGHYAVTRLDTILLSYCWC